MSGYPGNWSTIRRKVLRRDSYTCGNCGRSQRQKDQLDLHVHHIVPKSRGGTDSVENLRTLCSECHNAVHGDVEAPTSDKGNLSSTTSTPVKRHRKIKAAKLRSELSDDPETALSQVEKLRSADKISDNQSKYVEVQIGIELVEKGDSKAYTDTVRNLKQLKGSGHISDRKFRVLIRKVKKVNKS